MKPRALLIGGNGFIGSHLIDELLLAGYRVRVLDIQYELFRPPLAQVEYVQGSFADLAVVRDAIEDCQILVHMAHSTIPLSSLNHPEQEIFDSVGAFVNMINSIKQLYTRRIIYFSSGGAVYGNAEDLPVDEKSVTNPISPYGVSKLTMEKYLTMFSYLNGFQYLIVRPSNPFGPRQNFLGQQGVIPIFMHHILRGEPVEIWGDGSAIKDYIYVADLARAVVKLVEAGFDNSAYNIGSGEGASVSQLLQLIAEESGVTPAIEYQKDVTSDVKNIVLSSARLYYRTRWKPNTGMREGIRRTLEWYKTIAATLLPEAALGNDQLSPTPSPTTRSDEYLTTT